MAGGARDATAATASKRTAPYTEDAANLDSLRNNENVHTAAVAVDPATWELVRFILWRDEPEEVGTRYEVRHLSTPELHGSDLRQ